MPTITIAGREFNAPDRYTEGHTLTSNEASALNQLLAENLRNNFAGRVKKAEENHGKELPAEVEQELVSAFADYASAYEFGARVARGPRANADPVETEALKLMIERVSDAIRKAGRKISDYGREAIVNKAQELLAKGDAAAQRVYEVARTRVAEKQALASEDVDALGDLAPTVSAEPATAEEAPRARRGRKNAEAQVSA